MTDKETTFLKEWAVRYIKNRDAISKKIVSIEEFGDGFHVVRKDKEQRFFIEPFLKELHPLVEKIKGYQQNKALVCFHTRENLDILLKNWKTFVELGRNFTIFFVNPFSKTERVLSLSPSTHQLISDEDTLQQGVTTMSQEIEFTTEEEVKKILSS